MGQFVTPPPPLLRCMTKNSPVTRSGAATLLVLNACPSTAVAPIAATCLDPTGFQTLIAPGPCPPNMFRDCLVLRTLF